MKHLPTPKVGQLVNVLVFDREQRKHVYREVRVVVVDDVTGAFFEGNDGRVYAACWSPLHGHHYA